jgi:hypothetical protein
MSRRLTVFFDTVFIDTAFFDTDVFIDTTVFFDMLASTPVHTLCSGAGGKPIRDGVMASRMPTPECM